VITHKIVIHEDKTLNAEATIRFFQKIEKAYPSKATVHVFCDNAPYYRNKIVYTNNFKIWDFDFEKAPGLGDRKSINID